MTCWSVAVRVDSLIVGPLLVGLCVLAQVCLEPVHACLPGAGPLLHPHDGVVKRCGPQAVVPPLRLAASGDQPGPLEDLQGAGKSQAA
jgi:hypothetical protein